MCLISERGEESIKEAAETYLINLAIDQIRIRGRWKMLWKEICHIKQGRKKINDDDDDTWIEKSKRRLAV